MASAVSIPQRELRNNSAEVLRRVRDGESFVVTVRGEPVAELVPVLRPRRWVPGDAVAEAFRPQAPLPPASVDRLRELDAEIQALDDDDEDELGRSRIERLYDATP